MGEGTAGTSTKGKWEKLAYYETAIQGRARAPARTTARALLSRSMLATLAPCMDRYDVGEADAEWPNNILSTLTVVHSTGQIARRGELTVRSPRT